MPKRKSHKNRKGNAERIKGNFLLEVSAVNSGGLFVLNRFEIDTTLCSTWTSLGQIFQRWKIHSLTIRYVPAAAFTFTGLGYLAIAEDPEADTPVSAIDMMGQRCSAAGGLREPFRLHWRPRREFWLFTRDLLAQDDRLEMPGDLLFASDSSTNNLPPGKLVVHYDVSFDLITNSAVSLSKHVSTVVDQMVEKRVAEKVSEKLKALSTQL